MSRVARIVVVSGGLVLTGAVVGTLCAYVAVTVLCLPVPELRALLDAELFSISAIVGGALGAITAPMIFWGLLRFVPLGRAIGWCAVGSILGGVAGWFVVPVIGALACAVAGFVVAAVVLRRTVAHASSWR